MNSENKMNRAQTIALLNVHSRRARAQIANARRTLCRLNEHYEEMERELPDLNRCNCGNSERNDHTRSCIVIREPAPVPEPPRTRRSISSGMNLLTDRFDFSDDSNMHQRLVTMARATSDGVVIPTHARDILISLGISNAMPANLRNTLQKHLIECEHFVHIGPGMFRYIGTSSNDPQQSGAGECQAP